ncbi:MAG TPA: acyl-CoA thioester hydrolase/BAAT C-terminal domain-containing protein [Acidimicrobiales bacterium]|nr:acyl-CoA thioester hydrolase/BAAT C-terminal domain-containing protein [Acidimicrobiales bacterium]
MDTLASRTAIGPIRSTDLSEEALADSAAVALATIAVERIAGDAFLVSGRDDGMSPSTALANIAEERRRVNGRRVTHLAYSGAGHRVGTGFVPGPLTVTHSCHRITGVDDDLGGSWHADFAALDDCWPRILQVLPTWRHRSSPLVSGSRRAPNRWERGR